MYESAGPKALAIAAQRAREADEAGDGAQAEDWRRIRMALLERRGPRAT